MLTLKIGFTQKTLPAPMGEFHDQGDAKWIVIRGHLRGHNDTPFGQPTPGQPIGCPGAGRLQRVFGGLSCLEPWSQGFIS
jgi:hypothetical protein